MLLNSNNSFNLNDKTEKTDKIVKVLLSNQKIALKLDKCVCDSNVVELK